MKKTSRLLGVLMTVFVFVCSGMPSEAVTLTAYSVYPESNYHAKGLLLLSEKVKKYTNGEVIINVELGGSLGYKGQELLRAVKDGSLHISEMVSTGVAGDEVVFGVRSLPFLIDNWNEAARFDKIANKYYVKAVEKWNQKILYVAPWPFAVLWTKKPIVTIKDMKGLKTRTFDRNGALMMTTVGGTPVAMPFSECYTSLATGLIDSIITSGTTIKDGKLWEVLKYYQPINMSITTSMTNINLDQYNKLNEAQKKALLKASKEVETYLWETAQKTEDANLKKCQQNGIITNKVSPELIKILKDKGRKISDEWVKKNPEAKELYHEFLNH